MLKEEFNEKYKGYFEESCPGIEIDLYEETIEMLNSVFEELIKIPDFKLIEFKFDEETLKLNFVTTLSSFLNEIIESAIYGYEEFYQHKELEEAKEVEYEELEE